MSYVTYDDAGNLTGAFLQAVQPEHEAKHIIVTDFERLTWVNYRANMARDGVELAPEAPPALPSIPQQVTRRQARQALLLAGLLGHVPAKIAAIADPTARGMAQIEWDDSQIFERDRPLLIVLATQLGLTSSQLDALFVRAATL